MIECRLSKSARSGASFNDGGKGLLERCTISDNAEVNLICVGQANPTLLGTTIEHGKAGGSLFAAGGCGSLEDCVFTENLKNQISACGPGTSPRLLRCHVGDGPGQGLYLYERIDPRLIIAHMSVYGNNHQ